MSRLQTIDLKGKDYATVPTRLKAFREENPRSSVTTKPSLLDGNVVFEATIIKDLADDNSARATGHSYGKLTGDKAFEKQETIAVGRALALLGYLNDGQVATSEEMLEFEEYQTSKLEEAITAVSKATKRAEFEDIISKLSPEQQRELAPHIKARTKELADGTKN